MDGPDWTCLGDGPEHPADIEPVERIRDTGNTRIALERCRTCGQPYRWMQYELNEWSAGGDYSDCTTVWTALEPDEPDLVRRDPNYRPRSDRQHRHDSGWRREGG